MTEEKVDRINFLAKKKKREGLTEKEKIEQELLRREYIDSVKQSLAANLDNTFVIDDRGNKTKIKKKQDK